jgi:threonine dehydrogenase-like Zn-dependent dehydrogenase
MKAAVLVAPGRIVLDEKPVPDIGANDALIRLTTSICGTDVHILEGEYPAAKGLTIGHEPVGIVEKLGRNVTGYRKGQRVTAGARLRGATTIIAADSVPDRLAMAQQPGADHVVDFKETDPVEAIMALTKGRGVDSAIEALGRQATFEDCLEVLKAGGTLSSLGVHSADLKIPLAAFHAGIGDNPIVTSLCPGGRERMRRLMNVIASGRLDLGPLVTHHYRLDDIEAAYALFANQRDGVLKVAIAA